MAPVAQDVQNANPDYLTKSVFLVNLAVTFHVTSIPLAIFILILVCIACVLGLVLLGFAIRSCIRRKFVPKRRRKPHKATFLDEIPGVVPNEKAQLGALDYSLEYNLDRNTLAVGIIQASNIPNRSDGSPPDSYVSVRLFEQRKSSTEVKGKMQKTSLRKKTTNPIWGELFSYTVNQFEIKNLVVVFELFDYDNLGQDNSIGQLRVALIDLDPVDFSGKMLENNGYLESGGPLVNGIGELCVGLGYYPQFGRLDITIYEARQLTVGDLFSDEKDARLFVEAELKLKKKSLATEKTKTKSEVINPYFNEKMSFHVKNINLRDCRVICRLKNAGRLGTKKMLGYAMIGDLSLVTTGEKHWDEVLRIPSKTHVMWHVLVVGSKHDS